jgi:hypothetical protein
VVRIEAMTETFTGTTIGEARELAAKWLKENPHIQAVQKSEISVGDSPAIQANPWTVTIHYEHDTSN